MSSPEQIFASAQPTADLVRDAMKAAAYTKGLKIRDAIPVDQLLLALLEHAVGDEGRRHTACVVLAAQGDKDQMVEAAQVWLDHLLFPCEPFVCLLRWHEPRLTRRSQGRGTSQNCRCIRGRNTQR